MSFQRFGVVITVLSAMLVSGCGPGSITSLQGIPVVHLPGGATSLNAQTGSNTVFTVTDASYNGTYTATSSNTAVATVAPGNEFVDVNTPDANGGARTSQSAANATQSATRTAASVTSAAGLFTVTAVGPGTATITISQADGESTSFIVVVTGGVLVVSVPSIDLTNIGLSQTVTITQAGYAGAFTAVSANTNIATVSPGSGAGTFTITGVAVGSTSITFAGGGTQTVNVPVTVASESGTISSKARTTP